MKQLSLFVLLIFSIPTLAQEGTYFGTETGEYGIFLKDLEQDMLSDIEMKERVLGGKKRAIFVPWIRDHVHVMKAMKFIHADMTSFIEFYLENQTKEGIFFDYFYPLGYGGLGSRKKIFHPRYWKEFPKDSIEMHRLPVEADLEYLLVEGAYAVWQSTGDASFVKKWLPALEKGMMYSMTDPLRWSDRHQLVKRGYTLDTWDFMQLPLPRDEYTKQGGNVQKGIFDIDENTPMGIMHGDNSGMYYSSRKLAEMYNIAGDKTRSQQWRSRADHFRSKTNSLCWNGKFYAHFVEDDPQPSYLRMDQRNTLSLSNPYDINRGLPTEDMAQSIIAVYQDLKTSNSKKSFAEWYGVYPAVEPHFADYKPGSYMNGGVNTIVAGELAKAAFQHGFEMYGIDILRRLMDLMQKHNKHLPVAYTPEGKVDEGIPDNWGQAAVYSAMIEGLAGVADAGSQFSDVELSPRWLFANKNEAIVNVAYGPTKVRLTYAFRHDPKSGTISLNASGPMQKTRIRLPIPPNTTVSKLLVNGKSFKHSMEKVRESSYVVLDGIDEKNMDVKLFYTPSSK